MTDGLAKRMGEAAWPGQAPRTTDARSIAENVRPPLHDRRQLDLQRLSLLMKRHSAALNHAARGWRDFQRDVRQALLDCVRRVELSNTSDTICPAWEATAAHIDQAAVQVSRGAWAVGYDYRLTHAAELKGLPTFAELLDGSIPVECRRAIEPAIRFAHTLYGSLVADDLAHPTSEPDVAERATRSRAMYRRLASAAFASCRAGLAFDESQPT